MARRLDRSDDYPAVDDALKSVVVHVDFGILKNQWLQTFPHFASRVHVHCVSNGSISSALIEVHQRRFPQLQIETENAFAYEPRCSWITLWKTSIDSKLLSVVAFWLYHVPRKVWHTIQSTSDGANTHSFLPINSTMKVEFENNFILFNNSIRLIKRSNVHVNHFIQPDQPPSLAAPSPRTSVTCYYISVTIF